MLLAFTAAADELRAWRIVGVHDGGAGDDALSVEATQSQGARSSPSRVCPGRRLARLRLTFPIRRRARPETLTIGGQSADIPHQEAVGLHITRASSASDPRACL